MNTLLGAIDQIDVAAAPTGGAILIPSDTEFGGGGVDVKADPRMTFRFGTGGGSDISQPLPSEVGVNPDDIKSDTGDTRGDTGGSKKTNMLLIGGGLLLAYFLFFRKK